MAWPSKPRNKPNRRAPLRRENYGPLSVQAAELDVTAQTGIVRYNQPVNPGPGWAASVPYYQGSPFSLIAIGFLTVALSDDRWSLLLSSPSTPFDATGGWLAFDAALTTFVEAAFNPTPVWPHWLDVSIIP